MNWRRLQALVLPVIFVLLAGTIARAERTRLKLSECPSAVQQTFVAEAKETRLETITKETDDEATLYSTQVSIGGKPYEITVEDDGTLVEKRLDEEIVESEVVFDKAPEEVRKTFGQEAEGQEIETLNKTSQGDKSFYEAGVNIDGKNYWLMVDDHGRLLEKRLGFDIEEDEIDLNQAPAAVQETFKRIAQGAELGLLHKTTENGTSEFDTLVKITGRNYLVRVSDEGVLLEKSLDSPAEEEELELSDVPEAVRRTLSEEARGADIEAVIKKTENEESLYGISVELGDSTYWIVVNASGVLITKEIDD